VAAPVVLAERLAQLEVVPGGVVRSHSSELGLVQSRVRNTEVGEVQNAMIAEDRGESI
jgi:hypothetical protein